MNDFVRCCVVDVKCLPRLHGVVAEAYEGIMIDGIPKIVEARTELHLRNLIGQCIVGFDDDMVVAKVDRSLVADGDGRAAQTIGVRYPGPAPLPQLETLLTSRGLEARGEECTYGI